MDCGVAKRRASARRFACTTARYHRVRRISFSVRDTAHVVYDHRRRRGTGEPVLLVRILSELTMTDRTYVEKAADAGARKGSLLQLDPFRYLLRSVGAGMGLTIVVFLFWVLTQNLNDISLGKVIAAGFFGVGLTIIVFTNTELFTSNNCP